MPQEEPCPLCNQPSRQLWGGERATYRCSAGSAGSGCGVVWTVPPAEAAQPGDRFSQEYYERHYEPRAEELVQDFGKHLDWVEAELEKAGVRGRRWLDVGCGGGYFARAAVNRGWEVTGIDPSPSAVERARKTAPEGRYVCGAASALPRYREEESEESEDGEGEEDGEFDVISFWDSLFVVPRPHQELELLLDRLKPGGTLLIKSMHRPPHFFQATQRLLGWRPATRDDYAGVRHACWHFTPASAAALVRHHGLEPMAQHFTDEVPNPADEGETGLKALLARSLHQTLHRTIGPESFLLLARKPRTAKTETPPLRKAA